MSLYWHDPSNPTRCSCLLGVDHCWWCWDFASTYSPWQPVFSIGGSRASSYQWPPIHPDLGSCLGCVLVCLTMTTPTAYLVTFINIGPPVTVKMVKNGVCVASTRLPSLLPAGGPSQSFTCLQLLLQCPPRIPLPSVTTDNHSLPVPDIRQVQWYMIRCRLFLPLLWQTGDVKSHLALASNMASVPPSCAP